MAEGVCGRSLPDGQPSLKQKAANLIDDCCSLRIDCELCEAPANRAVRLISMGRIALLDVEQPRQWLQRRGSHSCGPSGTASHIVPARSVLYGPISQACDRGGVHRRKPPSRSGMAINLPAIVRVDFGIVFFVTRLHR